MQNILKCNTFFFFAGKLNQKFIIPNLSDTTSSSDSDSEKEKSKSSDSSSDSDPSPAKKKSKWKIPKHKFGKRTKTEIEMLRQNFPNLKQNPDEIFRTLSVTELIRLDTKLSKDGKSNKKLTEKLQKNFEKSKNVGKVKAGDDNRHDTLHEARFLGGHTCKHTEIWLQARKNVGISGLDPIARYDVETIGLSDKINCNIWNILHNPGSRDLSIRLFAPEALKSARGSEDKESALPKKEFDSVDEIRTGLASLRIASQLIYPWNLSITTLEFFLNTVNFGERDITNKKEKITFLSDFIDEVLLRNAEAWDDSNGFCDTDKISNKWLKTLALKFPRGGSQKTENQNQKQNNQNPKASAPQSKTATNPKFQNKKLTVPQGVCRRFNMNICPKQADDSCTAPWDQSTTLKHVCCHQNLTTKGFCMDKHTLIDHK